jgi:hypothetical protein
VLYDALEPKLNAGEIELLDITELQDMVKDIGNEA